MLAISGGGLQSTEQKEKSPRQTIYRERILSARLLNGLKVVARARETESAFYACTRIYTLRFRVPLATYIYIYLYAHIYICTSQTRASSCRDDKKARASGGPRAINIPAGRRDFIREISINFDPRAMRLRARLACSFSLYIAADAAALGCVLYTCVMCMHHACGCRISRVCCFCAGFLGERGFSWRSTIWGH